jgi:hypothetical protein
MEKPLRRRLVILGARLTEAQNYIEPRRYRLGR